MSVVLVGAINNDKLNQDYFGVFKIDAFSNIPILINYGKNGSRDKLEVTRTMTCTCFTFKDYAGGHGLRIRKNEDNVWTFTTGLRHGDSGSSGDLINGGPEMEQIYNSWLNKKLVTKESIEKLQKP